MVMGKLVKFIKRYYIRTTGYNYTNAGRLFLRLFVGVMLMQFGIRQMVHFLEMQDSFPAVFRDVVGRFPYGDDSD